MTSFADCTTKKARIAFIRNAMNSDARQAVRGMLRIFEYQTEDEKRTESTRDHNGVGFTGVDGEILSSFAKQVMAGRTMSPKQMNLIFKKMPKYAKQLEGIAAAKAAAADATEQMRDPNEEERRFA